MLPPLRQRMLEDGARLPNPATLRGYLRESLRGFPQALTSVREGLIREGAEALCGTNRIAAPLHLATPWPREYVDW